MFYGCVPKKNMLYFVGKPAGHQMLLLFRQGGRVVNNLWTGSAGALQTEGQLSLLSFPNLNNFI